jgi:hypothetical protein
LTAGWKVARISFLELDFTILKRLSVSGCIFRMWRKLGGNRDQNKSSGTRPHTRPDRQIGRSGGTSETARARRTYSRVA